MVYIIQIENNGPIKIGKAKYPPASLASIQTGLPYAVNIIALLHGEEDVEKELHQRFREHHIRGERFNSHEHILDFIYVRDRFSDPFIVWHNRMYKPYYRTSCFMCKNKAYCATSLVREVFARGTIAWGGAGKHEA